MIVVANLFLLLIEQVKMLLNYGVQDFCDYVRKVVENIPEEIGRASCRERVFVPV